MSEHVQLDYGAADAQAPSAGVVRPVLLFVGVLHAVAAVAGVAPAPLVWLAGLNFSRWSSRYPLPIDDLISAAAFVPASVAFAVICSWALARPDGRVARWVGIAAFAYAGVWLVDGLRESILILLTQLIIRDAGRQTLSPWAAALFSGGSAICRELGQTSILFLILYAFGRRTPPAERVLRAVAWAAVAVCALQVAQRAFVTAGEFARLPGRPPLAERIVRFLSDRSTRRFWTVGAAYALVCLLGFGTFRRRPRLAGTLIIVPFLVAEIAARGTVWSVLNVASPGEALTLAYDLSFLVFSATTPIAAFVLFTVLGRRLPRPETGGG